MLHMPCLHKHPSSTGRQTHSLDTEICNPCQSCGKQSWAEGGMMGALMGALDGLQNFAKHKQHFYRWRFCQQPCPEEPQGSNKDLKTASRSKPPPRQH